MSYDLSVYAAAPLSFEGLLELLRGTAGLAVEGSPSSDAESLMVVRGRRRAYCFTVDGPFEVESDDVPEEVAASVTGAKAVYQVLVEGSEEASIPHAVKFARKLAKATDGAMLDEQTGYVWPKPKPNRVLVPAEERRTDMVAVRFYMLNEDRPADLPELYIRTAREFFPAMLPANFNDKGFLNACANADTYGVLVKGGYPLGAVSYNPLDSKNRVSYISFEFDKAGLTDPAVRQSLKAFFIEFAQATRSFHASAEVRRGFIWKSGTYYGTGDSERSQHPNNPGKWAGLHAHPQWWAWFGPEYADLVSPYLIGNRERFGECLFHSWAEEPLNRDEISAVLPDPSRPWLPTVFTFGADEDDIINSYAKIIPARLQ
ncbi:hypothetical protein QO003_003712 [Arthrobacter silviterrae]|uniref:Uncharacterized protein n=1 Tax=Arthrobacter silviterrae TaxID=2026658 RepID=A0ABX0D605_9MICC|nr:hypothetical protein [Arthrobacter silviterrae]MDQ0279409.1 hypothetical protein [Arthrobacter silviterrae]NGN82111.1 hypothetical protein [Arthrobacter silviterrae]